MLEPPVSIERRSTCGRRARCARTPRARRGARARGPHAGEEERLVGVDVADAGEQRLIEQQRLDRPRARARRGEQQPCRSRRARRRRAGRGAEASPGRAAAPCRTCARRGRRRRGRRRRSAAAGGCARRPEACAAARARARRRRSTRAAGRSGAGAEELARHAQVQQQPLAVVEPRQQVLAEALERREAAAAQPRRSRPGASGRSSSAAWCDALDAAADEQRRELPPRDLDLGQLGHAVRLARRAGLRSEPALLGGRAVRLASDLPAGGPTAI